MAEPDPASLLSEDARARITKAAMRGYHFPTVLGIVAGGLYFFLWVKLIGALAHGPYAIAKLLPQNIFGLLLGMFLGQGMTAIIFLGCVLILSKRRVRRFADRYQREPYCIHCFYPLDIRENPGKTPCPECGKTQPAELTKYIAGRLLADRASAGASCGPLAPPQRFESD